MPPLVSIDRESDRGTVPSPTDPALIREAEVKREVLPCTAVDLEESFSAPVDEKATTLFKEAASALSTVWIDREFIRVLVLPSVRLPIPLVRISGKWQVGTIASDDLAEDFEPATGRQEKRFLQEAEAAFKSNWNQFLKDFASGLKPGWKPDFLKTDPVDNLLQEILDLSSEQPEERFPSVLEELADLESEFPKPAKPKPQNRFSFWRRRR